MLRKQQLVEKRKYHRGAFRKEPHWLFRIVDKINHKILLRFIENKDKLTILPIIYQHIQRGMMINSDGAKVYKGLMHMGFVHKTVIHKREFVAQDGMHTN